MGMFDQVNIAAVTFAVDGWRVTCDVTRKLSKSELESGKLENAVAKLELKNNIPLIKLTVPMSGWFRRSKVLNLRGSDINVYQLRLLGDNDAQLLPAEGGLRDLLDAYGVGAKLECHSFSVSG